MSWIEGLLGHEVHGDVPVPLPALSLAEEADSTQMEMGSTLVTALQARNPELRIVEHSAHVALIATSIAQRLGVAPGDGAVLQTAARLHELGMIAVPAELLRRRGRLSYTELARVRGQAAISAEFAAAVHGLRVAYLIRHQYDDYVSLQRQGDLAAVDLLLAGIFRVADVISAVTWPRPYQDPVPPERQAEVLESGAGTRFHPLAVHFALQH